MTHRHEFSPDPLALGRATIARATRCHGGGGGGSADQTQTQTQTSASTQQGVSDQGAGAYGDGSTAISITNDVSGEAIASGLQSAADIAKTGADAAYWTGKEAQQTARELGTGAQNAAYWTAADAQQTAQAGLKTAENLGNSALNVSYWLAADAGKNSLAATEAGLLTAADLGKSAFTLAGKTNEQNTTLLGKLAGLFTAGTSETLGKSLDFAGNAVNKSIGLAANTTQTLADTYKFNTDRLASMNESGLANIASLAKSTTTGGQTEVNKSFVWIVGIVGVVFALFALNRK